MMRSIYDMTMSDLQAYLTEKGYELTDVYNYAYSSDPNT